MNVLHKVPEGESEVDVFSNRTSLCGWASLALRHNSLTPGRILGGWFEAALSPQKTLSPTP